jgi:hypothetical protein
VHRRGSQARDRRLCHVVVVATARTRPGACWYQGPKTTSPNKGSYLLCMGLLNQKNTNNGRWPPRHDLRLEDCHNTKKATPRPQPQQSLGRRILGAPPSDPNLEPHGTPRPDGVSTATRSLHLLASIAGIYQMTCLGQSSKYEEMQ